MTGQVRTSSQPTPPCIARIIADELGVQERQVQAVMELLEEGATVPFIARYRKERTGGLDDTQLRNLAERLEVEVGAVCRVMNRVQVCFGVRILGMFILGKHGAGHQHQVAGGQCL